MKYYLVQIVIYDGKFEYSDWSAVSLNENEDIQTKANEIASTYLSKDKDEKSTKLFGHFAFEDDYRLTNVGYIRNIAESEYTVLSRFFNI